jgi:anti-sigma factor RsiW
VTLPDLHLGEDALVAYVDGMLSAAADERAARHLRSCPECRAAVDAEREAKALLGATPDPSLPAGLLARLLDVPMTADLGSTDLTLAVDGEAIGWSTGGSTTHVV